jgi:hypothetical protein
LVGYTTDPERSPAHKTTSMVSRTRAATTHDYDAFGEQGTNFLCCLYQGEDGFGIGVTSDRVPQARFLYPGMLFI